MAELRSSSWRGLGLEACVRLLTEAGANLDHRDNSSSLATLHMAEGPGVLALLVNGLNRMLAFSQASWQQRSFEAFVIQRPDKPKSSSTYYSLSTNFMGKAIAPSEEKGSGDSCSSKNLHRNFAFWVFSILAFQFMFFFLLTLSLFSLFVSHSSKTQYSTFHGVKMKYLIVQKVVLKVNFRDDRIKQKAMKTASGLSGVESVSVDMKDKKLTLSGDIDPVNAVSKLRKLCQTEILSVGPVKEEKEPTNVTAHHSQSRGIDGCKEGRIGSDELLTLRAAGVVDPGDEERKDVDNIRLRLSGGRRR